MVIHKAKTNFLLNKTPSQYAMFSYCRISWRQSNPNSNIYSGSGWYNKIFVNGVITKVFKLLKW